jgi:ABC-type Na+ efflux pump permease subunit
MSLVSPRRAWAVCWKDLLELRKNPGLLASMTVLPLVMVLVPAGIVLAYARDPNDPSLRTMAVYYDPGLPLDASAALFLVDKTLTDWFGLYLTMPVFIPILISSQSVAGEKERRTLEPLLASPVSALELVLGKSLASLIPAITISWLSFVILCVGVNTAARPLTTALVLPNAMWLFGVGVLAPLFAFFGNVVAVLVSARVGEARLAQQLSALVVLPFFGLVGAQFAGWLRAGAAYYATQGLVVLLLDALLLAVAVKLFDRERLVSRWS